MLIQVGSRSDSSAYVRMKRKACENAAIAFTFVLLPDTVSQHLLLVEIQKLNADTNVHGVLVQLPLPTHLDEHMLTQAILPEKDVDGFHEVNIGRLAMKGLVPMFEPCTPMGIMRLLEEDGIKLEGKNAVVVGRSNIVGMPIAMMMMHKNATVTIVHSKSENIDKIICNADILVAAVGLPNFIQAGWIKPGAVVIDVGINSLTDPSKKAGFRWVGDVDFDNVSLVAGSITPVPGGVGPMTVAMLLQNLITSATRFSEASSPKISHLKPDYLFPVPRYRNYDLVI